MKNLFSLFVAILVSVSLFAPLSPSFAVTVTTTQEQMTVTATSGADQTVEATTTTKVDYELPYPGMLPDNPLYFLKQARDWILDKLIVDPIKKAEFYILQADKRVAMGVMLGASGKVTLGEQIISKAEKYMNSAVQSLLLVKSQGKDVPAYIVDRLSKALAKHIEVIESEIAKAQGAEKAGLTVSLTLAQELQAELTKLK